MVDMVYVEEIAPIVENMGAGAGAGAADVRFAVTLNPIWADFAHHNRLEHRPLIERKARFRHSENQLPDTALDMTARKEFLKKVCNQKLRLHTWSNLILAGGSVARLLIPGGYKRYRIYDDDDRFINRLDFDFDLYLYGLGEDSDKIRARIDLVESEFCPDVVWRTECVVTMLRFSTDTLLQVILLKADTPQEVMDTFDVDESRAFFDGTEVFVTRRWIDAVVNRRSTFRNELASCTHFERICKYANTFGQRIRIEGLLEEDVDRIRQAFGDLDHVIRYRAQTKPNIFIATPERPIPLLRSSDWNKTLVIDASRFVAHNIEDPIELPKPGRMDTLSFGVVVRNKGPLAGLRSMYTATRGVGMTIRTIRSPVRSYCYFRNSPHRMGIKFNNRRHLYQWEFLRSFAPQQHTTAATSHRFQLPFFDVGPIARFARQVTPEVFADYVIGLKHNETRRQGVPLYRFVYFTRFLTEVAAYFDTLARDYEDTTAIPYSVRTRSDMFGSVGKSMDELRSVVASTNPEV